MNSGAHASQVSAAVLNWYARHARDLPWRTTTTTAWGVLVSEVMAQQTPVARVAPAWVAWMQRWPSAADVAAATPADVIEQWDRLGYPRRALRLRECAQVVTEKFAGEVPADHQTLVTLPGVGDYTAAAVSAFAFGRRTLVMDINVRRVHARVFDGIAHHPPHITRAERDALDAVVPDNESAPAWSQAVMELGAVICRPQPLCHDCPLQPMCAWHRADRPTAPTLARRPQSFIGTDRQVRGKVMALLRAAHGESVPASAVRAVWDNQSQLERAIASLLADGLAENAEGGQLRLPASTIAPQ